VLCDAENVHLRDMTVDFRGLGSAASTVMIDGQVLKSISDGMNSDSGVESPLQSGGLNRIVARAARIEQCPGYSRRIRLEDAMLNGASKPIPSVWIFCVDAK
jgi:hypothetical protein